jgi:hypothetical protein
VPGGSLPKDPTTVFACYVEGGELHHRTVTILSNDVTRPLVDDRPIPLSNLAEHRVELSKLPAWRTQVLARPGRSVSPGRLDDGRVKGGRRSSRRDA